MGSMRPPGPSPVPPVLSVGVSVTSLGFSQALWWVLLESRNVARHLDIEESHVLGVALDERAALLDVLAHEDREHLVRLGRVVEGHLEHQALLGVHRGLPQLLGVHLAQALVALDRVLLGSFLPCSSPSRISASRSA